MAGSGVGGGRMLVNSACTEVCSPLYAVGGHCGRGLAKDSASLESIT